MENIDFEFEDDLNRTYRCLTWEGEPWLFFLAGEEWMPIKTTNESEIRQFQEASMVQSMNF